MVGMGRLLFELGERLRGKAHLRFITAGWERKIGIVVDDSQSQWQLTISKGVASWEKWTCEQPVDMIIKGAEKQMHMLFGGNELVYTMAKQQVQIVGPLRDQLKLDAILRLTCK